jgi:hypothetical protein
MTQTSVNNGGEVVIYEAPDGEIRLDVRLQQDTIWLTQTQMAELFEKNFRQSQSISEMSLKIRNWTIYHLSGISG